MRQIPPRDDPTTVRTLSPRLAYNLVAREYDRWHWQRFWRENEAPLVLEMLAPTRSAGRVLDVGTGTGFYAERFLQLGRSVAGVDVSEEMLSVAREKLGDAALLAQGDAKALPFRTGSFDTVIAARVLSHMPTFEQALASISRVTAVGGFVVVTDVAPEHDYQATRVPVGDRNIYIDTYKHDPREIIIAAHDFGFALKRARRLTAKNLRWLPDDPLFQSIDRTGSRAIGHLLLLRRTRAPKHFSLRHSRERKPR